MSFKENLLKKMRIDNLAQAVCRSYGSPGNPKRMDKDLMRELLKFSPYEYRKERDLELYILSSEQNTPQVLVLDNELKVYRTTVDDVVIRKSPTVKEMLKFRNAIKILNDSNVVTVQKLDTVNLVHQHCLEQLDLTFSQADIDLICQDGKVSLELSEKKDVMDNLVLLFELVDFKPVPKAVKIDPHRGYAHMAQSGQKSVCQPPVIVYNVLDNRLIGWQETIAADDPDKSKQLQQMAEGKVKASLEGGQVFDWLAEAIMKKDSH